MTIERPPLPVTVVAPVQAEQAPQPSSMRVSQSSSTVLHASSGGAHASNMHVALQVCVPELAQVVVQGLVAPTRHVNPSSTTESQLSSIPLQISAGGVHTPRVQVAEHGCVPVVPHSVVHGVV